MRRDVLGLALCGGLLAGCPAPKATVPAPTPAPSVDPFASLAVASQVSGVVTGPKGYDSTKALPGPQPALTEVPMVGLRVTVANPALKSVPSAGFTTTDAQGRFALNSPIAAGIVLAFAASASTPLMAVFRDREVVTLSVASTMVAGKIAMDEATLSPTPDLRALPRAGLDAFTAQVANELKIGALKPDYGLASWPYALDLYTYRGQGALATALNALIPGSVAPPFSR